ncbi:MAG: hypothetical protein M1455_10250 [Actinobacteria bacterium]|nr:hypothetical protein [Actinomycetota bacterium]
MTKNCDKHPKRKAMYFYKNIYLCEECGKKENAGNGKPKKVRISSRKYWKLNKPKKHKKHVYSGVELNKLRDELRIAYFKKNPSDVRIYFVEPDSLKGGEKNDLDEI